MTLDFVGNAVWMRRLDLMAVSTLNLTRTGLPGDGGWAWRFVTGFETLHLACRDCSLFKLEVGYGKAFSVFDRHVLFAMVDARAQTRTAGSGHLAATPMVGGLLSWLPSGVLKTEFGFGLRGYLERDDANALIAKVETRWGIDRDWDLRATYDKHVAEVYALSLSRYW
jgi:hypothetical protein